MIKVQNHIDRIQESMAKVFYYLLRLLLSFALGFLSSRAVLFENFSPFSMIYLSLSHNLGLVPTFSYFGAALGVLFNNFDLSIFKYMTALTMIYVIYMVFQRSMQLVRKDTAILTAACCFTSGLLFLLVSNVTLFSVLLLIVESLFVCCCVYFVNYAARAFRKNCFLSTREIISIAITAVLLLIIFEKNTVFNINIARILCFGIIFLSFYYLKTGHTITVGACIGTFLTAIGNGGEAIFVSTIASTIIGSVFGTFSTKYSSITFNSSYFLCLILFGKFPMSYWLFAEPLIAQGLILLIPKEKFRKFLAKYIMVTPAPSSRSKPIEIEILFKSCKKECSLICPKSEICYSKNESELLEAIEKTENKYRQSGIIENVSALLPFCIKKSAMATTIEGCIVSNSTNSKIQMIDQLDHASRQLEICLNSAKNTTDFMIETENSIKESLSKRGITVKDIYFSVDNHNVHECDITLESNVDIDIPRIIHSTLKKYIKSNFTLKITPEEDEIRAHAKECSAYIINCAALCKTKKNESFCGDKALGFSAGKDLYYLLLTDGMGSGSEAHTQSEICSSSLQRLLLGGIPPIDALNIFRSTLRLRSHSSFSTIDVCRIDLKGGNLSFYKAGAYNSYLLKPDRCIEIPGGGLPIGLGDTDKVKRESVIFNDGDFLIMASDGIAQYNGDIGILLSECKDKDPKIFAKNILKIICDPKRYPSEDDISVIVSKFTKTSEI